MKKTWTKKQQKEFEECKSLYVINYITTYGRGQIMVKANYYEQFIKKFTKAFSDATIVSFEEIS